MPEAVVEALQSELKYLRHDLVDLECRLKFMQGRVRLGVAKAEALRALIAVYEREEND